MKKLVQWAGLVLVVVAFAGGRFVLAQEGFSEELPAQEAEAGAEAIGVEAEAVSVDEEGALGQLEEAPMDEGLISVDFKDADIRQVLRIISLKSGVDIVAGDDVEGLVTIKLTSVPWERALDIILRTYNFSYERKGRIVRIMTTESLEQEALATEVFPLNYARASEVPDIINEMLSDRGKVKFDERTNTLIVTDVPSGLFQISEVIARLDWRTPQVLIESKVIETILAEDEHLGIRWSDALVMSQSATALPSTFPWQQGTSLGAFGNNFIAAEYVDGSRIPPLDTTNDDNEPRNLLASTGAGSIGVGTLTGPAFSWTMNMLKQRQNTKIVSNPTLAVLNNQSAKIHIGGEYPIPKFSVDPSTGKTTVSGFEMKTTGTILDVTPHVNSAREIVVELKPEIISVGQEVTFTVGNSGESVSLPQFTTQTVDTQVRIRDGETIAIGGLVKTDERRVENKVPILGDLPIVGFLFKNTRNWGGGELPSIQQDLLIFLTVTLEDEDELTQRVAASRH